ncbi:MAG: ATP-grasp domain-containing protein [Gemmatimonadetes bacterium]|nr:ATP-grasp domain-containing protein [Gemmatimonadota bacterium]
MISPGYPPEMALFTRGLAEVGARVIGLGDQPEGNLEPDVKRHLSAYLQVGNFQRTDEIVQQVAAFHRKVRIDRVESLWEPQMILAARIREALGLPGMTVEETIPFRDKEIMKQVLDEAGVRTPRHRRCTSVEQIYAAAEEIGYPLIVKPIAGAGSADTYRVENREELEQVAKLVRHVDQVSVEEFIDAEEYTFDTVCAGGEILFHNVCWYRPRPLQSRQAEWISQQTIALRDLDAPELAPGIEMGLEVMKAMNFRTGFTHMEWYRTASGEAVFGEIGARSPGGRTVDLMNYANDFDIFTGWAEAVCHGRISQKIERRYNAASIFKRAQGEGNIQRIEGLSKLLSEYGEHIVAVDLLPLGAPRRNWRQTLISDGMVIVRHPDLDATVELANRVAVDLQIHAG